MTEDTRKPRLHLGCGTIYLPGYTNIDYPPDQQNSVQVLGASKRPDQYADITALHYAPGSIAEVRLHHVFEHFQRPVALRLLVQWYDWLCEDGLLTIETPDFSRCIKAYLVGTTRAKGKILRHLFGSHDAHWAVHCDGWDKSKFKKHLTALGFRKLRFSYGSWQGTYNVTVQARKTVPFTTLAERKKAAENLLRLGMVNGSEVEQQTLAVWMNAFQTGLQQKP